MSTVLLFLASLAYGFHVPLAQVLVEGIDVRNIQTRSLRQHIAMVPQETILFSGTIADNISYGRPGAAMDDIVNAAKAANAHEFIDQMPLGYDTPLGEAGVGLSGGQKQRVSIARAFLKNAPIVILDEITSNVDPVNEAKIQQAISNLAKNRTVLVIAHHLRTIRTADNILVFNEGEIVQAGTHNELIKQDGLYQTLWRSQEETRHFAENLAGGPGIDNYSYYAG